MGTITIDELLFLGIKYKDLKIAEYAFENGASLNRMNASGYTPFQEAAILGSMEIGEFLLANGADKHARGRSNTHALHLAVIKGQTEFIRRFLTRDDADVVCADGNTLLHLMVTGGRAEMAQIYMDSGLGINKANDRGYTPLHLAVIFDRSQILLDLLAHKAEITADLQGNTPLHLAATYDQQQITEILLVECCLFLDIKNSQGKTAIQLAEEHGHYHIAELLQEAKEIRARGAVAKPTVSSTLSEYLHGTQLYNSKEGNGNGRAGSGRASGVNDSAGRHNYRSAFAAEFSIGRKPSCSRKPPNLLRGNTVF